MAGMRLALKRDNADLGCDVAQFVAVLRSWLKLVKQASSITESGTNVSTGQGTGSSSAPES